MSSGFVFLHSHPSVTLLFCFLIGVYPPTASEPVARANGCSVVRTYVGHGINDLFHGAPNIPHYAKNKAVGTMKPGMVSHLSTGCLVTSDNALSCFILLTGIHHRACESVYFRYAQYRNKPFPLLCSQMINLGMASEVHWPDNWTATTVDGKRSAQFEETLL